MVVFFYQVGAQILYFNTFITFVHQAGKEREECNTCIKIKNLCIKLAKKTILHWDER